MKIQKEACGLQEQIEQHLDVREQQRYKAESLVSQVPVDWLVSGLHSALGPLQEAGDEAEMMAFSSTSKDGAFSPEARPPLPTVVRSPSSASRVPSHQWNRQSIDDRVGVPTSTRSPNIFGAPDTIPCTSPDASHQSMLFLIRFKVVTPIVFRFSDGGYKC